MDELISIDIQPQPNEITCGPTCLHAVYGYYGDKVDLNQIIQEVPSLEGGGTLAVLLGTHALHRGYKATVYTYNLQVFDPTWFEPQPLSAHDLSDKLRTQAEAKHNVKLQVATKAYLNFLQLGGQIRFQDLSRSLLRGYLKAKCPILTGLSSTFLYHCCREYGYDLIADDIKGMPEGHFVILNGYDSTTKLVSIADPFQKNPYSSELKYAVSVDRVICAILLGILTYDANFLIIQPNNS